MRASSSIVLVATALFCLLGAIQVEGETTVGLALGTPQVVTDKACATLPV
jgi:hypothetical protein